ncbi:MAG: glycerophosphodiester phosphodiesterase [Gemmatimonadota bacterium]
MSMAAPAGRDVPDVLAGGPLLIAHRGGSGLAPENTLAAFRQAAERWPVDMMELDVHATVDGHCVVIHDATVDRTTDGQGAVAELSLAELKTLDAGYRFELDGEHPFRGRGVQIPTLDEVLDALPGLRLTIEVKAVAAQTLLFEAIRRHDARDRVVAAGIHDRERTLFGTYDGTISASAEMIRTFWLFQRLRLARFRHVGADVVQVPEREGAIRVVTPRFIRDLHAQGVPVHVWTVDDVEDMHRLLDWGVDGIITDRPDRLAAVLAERRA